MLSRIEQNVNVKRAGIHMSEEFAKLEIVRYLEEKAPKLYAKVDDLYNLCESILTLIPKVFSNYTIHDIHHAIRVIGYINELVKDHLDRYSYLHIALIIYAGLLHDTGMFVSDDEQKKLYAEFAVRVPGFEEYTEEEKRKYLQDYVRENHGRRVSTVIQNKINEDAMIKSLFYVGKTNSYDISSIVIAICQAHMESSEWVRDCEELNKACYENDDINPRQIAVLLRIGDYLDIDDRRAPYVLYSMLNPQGYSDGEWKKHIPITNYKKIEKRGDLYTIIFSGKCSEPEIYRKVEDYIGGFQDQLSKDIQLCTDVYRINIDLPIIKAIETVGFDSTPLKFSLDYKQISTLLMGEHIYGSKKAGLRELLQNAIDAVLLMKEIHERLSYTNYYPEIRIDIRKDINQIVVFDNGIGMSEAVLNEFFFNIGNSYYESKDFNRKGYKYIPIGHFGIGFLACFMLSSKVVLETKHYEEGSKTIRMSFDKNSPYVIKYKDEKTHNIIDHGTGITLSYDEVIPGVFSDEASLQGYIQQLLIRNTDISVLISHGSGEGEKVSLKKPKYIYKSKSETIEFTDVAIKQPVLYGADDFFLQWKGEAVFIYDGLRCYNLQILYDYIKKLGAVFSSDSDLSENLDGIIAQIPFPSIKELLSEHKNTILSACNKSGGIDVVFCTVLQDILNHDYLEYCDFNILSFYNINERKPDRVGGPIYKYRFLGKWVDNPAKKCEEQEINERFIHRISDRIKVFSVINFDKNQKTKRRIQNNIQKEWHIECSAYDSDISRIYMMKIPEKRYYIPIDYYPYKNLPPIYVKGIYVSDHQRVHLKTPYRIHDLPMIENHEVYYNFVDRQYSLNVSRNGFDDDTKEELAEKITCLQYMNRMANGHCSDTEKEAIETFLIKYYEQTYDDLKGGLIEEIKWDE